MSLSTNAAHAREEVVFWHFWGGADRPVVERIVEGFNASQDRYRVRAIAMPGANLDLKFFLSVAGGSPPDVMNQDDPVVADWAHRGLLASLEEMASAEELERLEGWLFPAARRLGSFDGRLYALCNGLDIRALYCNQTLLAEHGLSPPRTLEELDRIAETIAPHHAEGDRTRMGYLPDPRRLWAWGAAFGGSFYDSDAEDVEAMITADSPRVLDALRWMGGYADRYGPSALARFRSGEQALTGASFTLLNNRRYAVQMDGQWRLRDVAAVRARAAERGEACDEITVVPLPRPAGGVANAGWVNGNFFVVPHNARSKDGAWAFMKYWAGFGNEAAAGEACAAGGWIPASERVVASEAYQAAIEREPLLRVFVDLAASEYQQPVPPLPVASHYYQEVIGAAQDVLYRGADPDESLRGAAERVRRRLRGVMQR
ncbi:MAG: extracellular solute-binding protein [Planctomycetota bacterium]